jgi:hypothetical protein
VQLLGMNFGDLLDMIAHIILIIEENMFQYVLNKCIVRNMFQELIGVLDTLDVGLK